MAVSPSNPAYLAEETPPSITRIGAGLRAAYARPATAFGAKGNLAHTSGYHRSRRWILTSPDSRRGARDYSVTQPLDQGGDANDVSAFDFTPGEWGSAENRRHMREITGRVYVAARARDPRLANLREFAGTLDGKVVITFSCADGTPLTPFDISHLDHIHGSIWRSRAANDHTGILDVMLGTEGDDDMFTDDDRKSLTDIRTTLGALIQGFDKTGVQSNGLAYTIVPNVLLKKIAAEVNIDPAELLAIQKAAEAGAASAADDIVAGIVAALPEGMLTQQDVETAIRKVLGGLDEVG